MALTVSRVGKPTVFGDKRITFADVTFDASYATGGEALVATDLGFILTIDFVAAEPSSGGYVFKFDHTNNKLVALYGDNNNAADGPLIEVPNATDLSAVTCRVFAVGT